MIVSARDAVCLFAPNVSGCSCVFGSYSNLGWRFYALKALGKALSVELYNCNRDILNDVALVEQYLQEAALEAKATIVETVFHLFSPYGVSGVVVISESHLAIHTWPEYGYAAIDIFTCGTTIDPWVACHYLKDKFQAESYEAHEIRRGRLDDIVKNSVNHQMLTPEYFSHKPAVQAAAA